MPRKPPRPSWRTYCLRPRGRAARFGFYAALIGAGGLLCLCCVWAILYVSGTVLELSGVMFTSTPAEVPKPLYPLQTAPPYTVALDAGHGGGDPGAKALLDEVIVCEGTTDALYALLEADTNFTPVRTRENGEDLSTSERTQIATEHHASLLLSIHANCDKSTAQSHGFECFPTPPGRLYSEQSMQFARCIANGMGAAGHRLRGEGGVRFAYYYGKSKRMVEISDTTVRSQKSFGLVERVSCPAVLAEQCFLTNRNDVAQWASPEGMVRAARIYYEAICTYFGTQPLPSP